MENEEIGAWSDLLDEVFAPGRRVPTQEECDILDGWEFEVHGEE